VHVQSRDPIPAVFAGSFKPSDFEEHIVHRTLGETTARLRGNAVAQVLAGAESGVELADELSEALGTLSNGTEASAARRDKVRMVEALERNGVRAIPTTLVRGLEAARSWAEARYPVVAKPRRSCGTDNVWFCDSWPALERAFHRISNRRTVLDERNDGVVLQEFIEGTEYIVDTVRYEGTTAVTEICRYRKKLLGDAIVYDVVELLPATGFLQETLSKYAFSVLDALQIRFGPAHLEIMVDASGPVLVEVGARLDGARAPELCRAATYQDQAEMTVACYTDRDDFERRAATPYVVHNHLLRVKLISERTGRIAALPFLEELRRLPSFYSTTKLLQAGDELKRTTGLFDLPGIIELVHPCEETIWEDYEKIRAWERIGFFELEPR
jgi:biotin carboxylase